MARMDYALWYRLGNRDRYLIWCSQALDWSGEDRDGVLITPGRVVPCFLSMPALRSYAQKHSAAPMSDEEPLLHDLDILAHWLRSKRRTRARHVDCDAFLAAWNLFGDLSLSLGASFDADKERTRRIYLKLFYGNNLPAVTPPGEWFVPYWSGREMDMMHEVLSHGLALFRASVRLSRED